MKKMYYLFAVVLLLFTAQAIAQTHNTVTFQANMTTLLNEGFDPDTDTMTVQGLNWDSFTTTIEGSRNMTVNQTDPNIFQTELIINTAAQPGDSLRWKFRAIDPEGEKFVNDGWEGGFGDYDGYPYYVQEDGAIVADDPKVPNIGVVVTGVGIQNTLNFNADISGILGNGENFFDPETDELGVSGLDWDGLGTLISDAEDRVMEEDEFIPGLFTTSLIVEAPAEAEAGADSTKWKYRASPYGKFSNDGWEQGPDRWHVYQEDGAVVELPEIVPDISPLGAPTETDVTARFMVDMGENPMNTGDNVDPAQPIPLDQVEFCVIKGADSALGAWLGDWVLADTAVDGTFKGGHPFREMWKLNDDGVNGDRVAGDDIYSAFIVFPAGTRQGATEYKYGAQYPDASVHKPNRTLDNEGPTGTNHSINFDVDEVDGEGYFNALNLWADFDSPTSVEQIDNVVPAQYTLEQNYPNPFNPSTIIRYSIPEQAIVTLKIYNLLGQEVATLVNTQQTAGQYEATFDAARLSSGVYFYTLNAGDYSFTKKMMLLK